MERSAARRRVPSLPRRTPARAVIGLVVIVGVFFVPALLPHEDTAQPPNAALSFHSRPDLRPPAIEVVHRDPRAARGDLFLAPKNIRRPQAGPMIVDGRGRLVWFHPLPPHVLAYDFRTQSYRGRRVLTWWQGHVKDGLGDGHGVIADSSYRIIARVRTAPPYRADLHEFQLSPHATAFFTIFHPVRRDLSAVGGPANARVLDSIVQEVDVKTGRALFTWHSLDHVPVTESYKPMPKGSSEPFDYFHVNSIQEEPNGHLLVSARRTNAIYEIDRRTGAVRWRLGGKRSDFRMGPGTEFVGQHLARRQRDGTISLFDNQGPPATGHQSRGLVLRIDRRHGTARVEHQYTHPSGAYSVGQGSAQVLPNGDVFFGWGGSSPYFSEYARGGRLLFDGRFAAGDYVTYRAYRFPWRGRPLERPRVAVTPTPGDGMVVYASWNGATGVARWQVLGGRRPDQLTPLRSRRRADFETAIDVRARRPFVAVRAIGRSGRVLGASRVLRLRRP
jgi:hypothetical protein